jgi:hypothetical protein
MKHNQPLHELLYVSTLAPDQDVTAVASIARGARVRNNHAHITGVLVFDGMRFCQQLEGTQAQMQALEQKIRLDTRHINMQVLHHGPLDQRRFKCFTIGYSLLDDSEVLARLEAMEGQAAVNVFLALMPHVDLCP